MACVRFAVRPAVLAAAVVASALVLVASAFAGGGDPVAGDAREVVPGLLGDEVTELRTRTSKTFESAAGVGYVSRLSSAPVHYRDSRGRWQEIDDALVPDPDGPGFTNRANRHQVHVPGQLAGNPVRIADGRRWLAFELDGASAAPAAVGGNRARFEGAFGGVAVELEAHADALKETLTLASADARSSFAYRLDASRGLRARETRDGGVELVDSDGDTHFALPAPFVYEGGAAGESEPVDRARFALERSGDGWLLRLSVDRDWLERPGRRFPVVVDPTVNLTGPGHDCTLDNEVPTTSACSNTTFSAGHWNGFQRHGVVKFDVAGSSIPRDAIVLRGTMGVKESSAQSLSTPKNISAHRITRSWAPPATWNTYDGTNAWATAGGEYDATALDTKTINSPGTFFLWQMTDQVQRWVDRSQPDHGVLLKGSNSAELNKIWFHSSEAGSTNRPYLEVAWEPRMSERGTQTLDGQPQLNDRGRLSVNVANGNLQVVNRDLQVSGRMLDTVLARYFNSRWNQTYSGAFGRGATGSLGIDVWLRDMGNGDAGVFLGNGAPFYFKKSGTNTFRTPPEIDADLKYDPNLGNGDYVLTFRRSGLRYVFSELGWPVKRIEEKHLDGTGIGRNKIELAYDLNGMLDSIVDTQGRTLDVTSNSSGRITGVSDPSGRTWGYSYGSSGGATNRLTTYTDPEGKTTTYDYDTNGNLIKITTPGGRVTEFTWHTDGKLKDVKRLLDAATSDYAVTNYVYSTAASGDAVCNTVGDAKTVVTNPRGKITTYCADPSNGRVRKVVDALNHQKSNEYTPHGSVTKLMIPGGSGGVYNLNFDQAGTDPTQNLTGGTAPAGETFSIAYPDPATTTSRLRYLPTQTTNEQGSKTNFEYDNGAGTGIGDVTAVKDGNSPTQVKATLAYNADGTLQTATDGNGRTTTYDYFTSTDTPTPPANQIGNLEKIVSPSITNPVSGSSLLGDQKFTYDSLGRISTYTDGKNQVQTFTYDKLDRITKVAYTVSGVNQGTIDYTYDFDGNRTLRRETVGANVTDTSYVYDKLNRQTKETYPASKVNDYTYDKAGNLSVFKSTIGSSSYQVSYGYDDVNNMTSLAEPGGTCPTTRCTTQTYDDRDRPWVTTLPNGVAVTRTYDTSSKPKTIKAVKGTNPALVDLTYDYADASTKETLLQQKVTDGTNSDVTTHLYDANDRLKKAETKNGTTVKRRFEYTFDNASNRREEQFFNGTSTATTTYKYNEGNQLCWERGAALTDPLPACNAAPTGSTTYVHDAAGNETSNSAGRSFSYNVRNQVTSHTQVGGSTFTTAHLGEGQAENTQFGTPTFLNSALGVQVRTSSSGNYFYIRTPGGAPIGATYPDGGRAYFLTDALGSVLKLTDVNGGVLNTYTYEPYGADLSTTGSTSNYIKYAGGFDTTGAGRLYHFGARYYDPLIGRWTQQDPLDQVGDLKEGNKYAYVGGDPINATDPSGEVLCLIIRACRDAVYKPAAKKVGAGAKWAAKRFYWLPCYVISSAGKNDTNSLKDDVWDAVQCVGSVPDND